MAKSENILPFLLIYFCLDRKGGDCGSVGAKGVSVFEESLQIARS